MEQLNVRLLLTIAAKTVFGWVILSCKSQVFSNNFEFDHHFQEISFFLKLTILGKSIFEGFDCVEMWWEKNSFTNQVVKNKFAFRNKEMEGKILNGYFWFFFSHFLLFMKEGICYSLAGRRWRRDAIDSLRDSEQLLEFRNLMKFPKIHRVIVKFFFHLYTPIFCLS